jgi:protein SCO1
MFDKLSWNALLAPRRRLALMVATLLVALLAGIHPAFAAQKGSGRRRPKWNPEGIADFSLIECHDGRTVTKKDLLGQPWVVGFIFTRCAGPCPLVSTKMKLLQSRVKDLSVRLVTITVDPENDTPEALKRYAKLYAADPEKWWFLTGDKEEIFRLIRGSFRQLVYDTEGAERLPGFEVAHELNLMHVNAEGVVMGKYNAQNDVEMARLARILAGKEVPDDQTVAVEEESDAPKELDGEVDGAIDLSKSLAPVHRAPIGSAPPPESAPDAEDKPPIPRWVLRLPAVNASLNGLATLLLLAGFVLVKARKLEAHKGAMLAAFVTSTAFLGCYLVYHLGLYLYTGISHRTYAGPEGLSLVYYAILYSHLVLAITVPVLAPLTIWRGVRDEREKHRKIARITFPIWLYVSVTGVIIYLMLYHLPAGNAP